MSDRDAGSSRDMDTVPSFLRQAAGTERGSTAEAKAASAATAESRPAAPDPETPPPAEATPPARLDPASLPMPTLSRRRLVTAAGALAAALLTLGFARQVGEASAATDR